MNIKVFTGSANSLKVREALMDFSMGIAKYDDVEFTNGSYLPCDCAVIFGSWKIIPKSRGSKFQHHFIKEDVVREAPQFVVLETPLLGRQKVELFLEDNWYRIGIGGFLADDAIFPTKKDASRWELIRADLNIDLEPWTINKDGHILIALQLPNDASLRGIDIAKWAYESALEVRKRSNNKIIIREPQIRDKKFNPTYMEKLLALKNVELQLGTYNNLFSTIKASYCNITYSSGLGIDSLMRGIPTIACSSASFAQFAGINDTFDYLENVEEIFRLDWVTSLSYCQWHKDELLSGEAWKHIREKL